MALFPGGATPPDPPGIRVGVIGVGMIGQDHIRRITQVLTGGSVTAVNDVDAARAGQVAAGLPGAVTHATAQDLIADGSVDAVLVTSWGPAHEEQVLAAIDAGVGSAHILDGRIAHVVLLELLTDAGVGTMITRADGAGS